MWKVTLGYGSFPPSQSGGLATGVGGGGGAGGGLAPTSRPLGIQTRSPQRTLFF
jgi:hypothetical protein